MLRNFLLCLILLTLAGAASAAPVRIKDLVEFDGVRGNDLVGYGLVVGLNGSGDGLRNAPSPKRSCRTCSNGSVST